MSATSLTASVSASLIAKAGSATVTVTTAAGTSNNLTFNIGNGASVPTVAALSPPSGAAGTSVTVTGTNFTGATAVNFGATPATSFTVNSATSITAVSPAGTGTVDVTVITSNGTSATVAADQFTYVSSSAPTLTGISPASGSPSGGTSVAVTGTNFTGATAVNFGATPATGFTVNSATSITAVSPAGTGTVDIAVVTPNGTSPAVAADQFTFGGSAISGVVVGGTGTTAVGLTASVQLYAAGTTAYGPVASPGATKVGSAVQTDPTTGAFTVAYSCSTAQAPSDQLYLVATGSNNQVVLMTALGACGGLQAGASYTINEATTVASIYALQQFMAADGSIGASIAATTSQSYTGLSNAFKTVNNLVDPSSGTVRDHTPDYSTNFAGDPNIVNNSTVPQARINTLANALNVCVSNSSGCGGLFADAMTGSAPANTLQAILNIAQNPGNNVSGVYTASGGSTAYAPVLAGAPNDWTLALTFTGGGLGIAPSVSGTDSAGNSGVGPNISTSLAIDANGNVFVAGFGQFGYPSSLNLDLPILAEFNNLGAPQTPPTTVSSDATPVIAFGGNSVEQGVGSEFGLSSVAIDTSGNIWAGDLSAGGSLFTVSPSLSLLASAVSGQSVHSVAIDNNNNAWVGGENNGEYTYVAGNTTLQAVTLAEASSIYSPQTIDGLAFDSAFNLWAYNAGNTSSIFQITTDGSFVYSAFPTRGAGSRQAMSLAADGMGNVYACGDAGGVTLDVFTIGLVTSGNAPTAYMLPEAGGAANSCCLMDRDTSSPSAMDLAAPASTVPRSTSTPPQASRFHQPTAIPGPAAPSSLPSPSTAMSLSTTLSASTQQPELSMAPATCGLSIRTPRIAGGAATPPATCWWNS